MAAPSPDQLPRMLSKMREMIRQIEDAGRAARAALVVNAVPLPAPVSPSSTSSDPLSD